MIILDSHIWFWWINQELHRFSANILEAIKSADRVGVSPVSCSELALAHKRGRLALPLPPFEWFRLALYGYYMDRMLNCCPSMNQSRYVPSN